MLWDVVLWHKPLSRRDSAVAADVVSGDDVCGDGDDAVDDFADTAILALLLLLCLLPCFGGQKNPSDNLWCCCCYWKTNWMETLRLVLWLLLLLSLL